MVMLMQRLNRYFLTRIYHKSERLTNNKFVRFVKEPWTNVIDRRL
jgi:hypothetical protein